MKVALINPNTRSIGRVATTNPPLGLLYLASVLREHNHEPVFVDADVDNLNTFQVAKKISGCDLVGITMVSLQASSSYDLATRLKSIYPDLPIVFGGSHPSGMKERIFKDCKAVDYVVFGEGENTLLDLANDLPLSRIDGLIYRDSNGVVVNSSRQRLDDLDLLPFPAVDLAMPIKRYKPYYPPNSGENPFPVMAGRGCPNHCTFCGTNLVWGCKLKLRSPENVLSEVKWLHDQFSVDEIYYLDDTLNMNREWFMKLLKLQIVERFDGYPLLFKGSVRANKQLVDHKLFCYARLANFWLFAFGVESGVQFILDKWKKNLTLYEVRRAVKILHDEGLKVVASFILGNPDDTLETILKTIAFAKELKPDFYDFPIATPLPNTEFEHEAEELGLIESRDWSKYAMGVPVCRTKKLSSEDLRVLRSYAFSFMNN